jgi:hypothetical protein
MKGTLCYALCCVIRAAVLLLAVQSFAQRNDVSLDLGPVTVRLGMPKREVLQKFSDAGYKVLDIDSKDENGPLVDGKRLFVTNKTPFPIQESWQNSYDISFTAGRLSYAERSWFNEKDLLSSVIEAVGSLTGQGSRSCSVTYSPISHPGSSARRVFIECGKRSVLLLRGEYESAGSTNPHFEISERIGNPPQ